MMDWPTGGVSRRLCAVALAGAVTAGGLLLVPVARADAPADDRPGCEARSAVAHHAGGVVLDPQPANAPIPCMTYVGSSTDSANVGVTNTGAVFFGPVGELDRSSVTPPTAPVTTPPLPGVPVGAVVSGVANAQQTIVARSRDFGKYWDRVVPGPAPVPVSSHGSAIPWMSVDPETSRIWYATPLSYCGVNVSWSDDEGASWDKTVIPCPTQGSNELLEGPAPAGGAQPTSAYPHVVYYCANLGESPFATRSSLVCHKSLDGGHTFVYNALQTPDSIPARDECGGPSGFSAETRPGVVGRDGVLYFPQNVCGRGDTLGLAISRDEGATWEHVTVAHTTVQYLYPPAIAADANNNLYLSWRGEGGLPYLTISRDGGATWSTPIQVGAPGVNRIRQVAVAARDLGHVSISYLGSTDGGETYNAYITESRDALAADPIFWSASVNNPAQPVGSKLESGALGDRIQFLTGMIGPDGTPWAAFHCAATQTSWCPASRLGVVGRLVHQ